MLCKVLNGARVLPDERTEEHFPIRVITDCKSLIDRLEKDASVPEDRWTALTVASLRERCSAGVARDTNRSGLMWVPTRVQLADGLTKSSAGVLLRNALASGGTQLTHRQSERSPRRLSCPWILSRKIGGTEDTTLESPAQDPSPSTFSTT